MVIRPFGGCIGIDKTFEPAFASAYYVDLRKTAQKMRRNDKSPKQAKLPKGLNLYVANNNKKQNIRVSESMW